jgi:hypothetical protein
MYEITHRGAWFNWKALDRRDKMLASLSLLAMVPPAVLTGFVGGDMAYRFGYEVGSAGMRTADTGLETLFASSWWPAAVLVSTLLAAISAFAWWRFSVRQDEMFNRIQNLALGAASAWTMALFVLWWLLSLGDWVSAPVPVLTVLLYLLLVCGFWFRAVHKWAS